MTSSDMPSRIALKRPFADSGTKSTIGDASGNDINYIDGFPSIYGVPASSGGRFVTRGEMNALGNVATNDLFYHKAGGINTFDATFAAKVGGYPKGAILKYLNGTYLYDVISLVDNNTFDFVTNNSIDNVNWAYCNKDVASNDMTLIAETMSITTYNEIGTEYANFSFVPINVVKAPKNGPIIPVVDGGISVIGTTTGTTLTYGVCVACKSMNSTSSMPSMPTLNTLSGWTVIYSDNTRYSTNRVPISGSMNAVYGKYYCFAYFSASNTAISGSGSTYGGVSDLSSIKLYIS